MCFQLLYLGPLSWSCWEVVAARWRTWLHDAFHFRARWQVIRSVAWNCLETMATICHVNIIPETARRKHRTHGFVLKIGYSHSPESYWEKPPFSDTSKWGNLRMMITRRYSQCTHWRQQLVPLVINPKTRGLRTPAFLTWELKIQPLDPSCSSPSLQNIGSPNLHQPAVASLIAIFNRFLCWFGVYSGHNCYSQGAQTN